MILIFLVRLGATLVASFWQNAGSAPDGAGQRILATG
jgi:hypothetical protein